jgi:predicted amidohydrolase YtcJ
MAQLAFHGGPILSMDPAVPAPEVVIVDDGRVVAAGGRDLLAAHAGARRVDLGGGMLVPGFIDAHNHLSIVALQPRWGDASAIADRDALGAAVREQAGREPDAPWVRLFGWDETRRGLLPSRLDLDAAGVERPVVLAHSTLHQAVVSSAGLDALGIGGSTPDPDGGTIGRGADGQPTGLLVERAWSQAHARSVAAYADPDRWAEHIAVRARRLLADGITCVHDAACSPAAEAVYRAMAAARDLPVSVVGLPHADAILTNDVGSRLDGPPTGEGDEQFRVGPVKLFADGGVAIALDTSIGGRPLRYGTVMPDLEPHALRAIERGFRIAVHAIGNVGIDRTLDVFTTARRRAGDDDHRFRIEHAGVSGPDHWRRLHEVGAIAVVQPGFVEHVGCGSAGTRFDAHHWLAFAGLAEAGVTLAGSSDDPCAPVAPLWCAAKGASRTTSTGIAFEPDQAVPMEDWLRAYTIGAALAGGQERERGSITPGKRADFVVLEPAPGRDEPFRVASTWVLGACVHDAERAGAIEGSDSSDRGDDKRASIRDDRAAPSNEE